MAESLINAFLHGTIEGADFRHADHVEVAHGLLARGSFAHAMEKSHVDPKALGSGYVVFFFYSGLVGVISMALAVIVARRTPTAGPSQPSDA